LPETALAGILDKGPREFFTDNGRPIREQGGVEPDQNAEPWRLEQWEEFLQQTTAFVNYAQTYIDRHGSVPEDFQVDDATVEDFRGYLGQGSFVPPQQEWQRALPFLRMHLQAEILNLVFGITKGDEAESRADPQLQAAAGAMEQARRILAMSRNSAGRK
jgi:carboxyl-terminal processing protease